MYELSIWTSSSIYVIIYITLIINKTHNLADDDDNDNDV